MQKNEALREKEDSEQINQNKIWLDKREIERHYLYTVVKRVMDIVGSIIGLIITMPIILWVALKIRQEEPRSPIFFNQIRVGKNGETFKMYKFRSMCVNAEDKLEELLAQNEIQGAMFKMKEDPWVTKIGKFIREKSIDELPQLWNVLKGEMSLVGPRPPLIREVVKYTEYDLQRLYTKPGCSGLWQVSGRSDLNFKEMVELDVEYIASQSVKNDVKIMLKTIGVMVHPNGAY